MQTAQGFEDKLYKPKLSRNKIFYEFYLSPQS